MKKVVSFLIGVSFLCVLISTSGLVFAAKPSLTITQQGHWTPGTNELFEKQCKEWGDKNGVDVKVEWVHQDTLPAKVATAAETGVGPDIIVAGGGYFPALYAKALVDVSDLAEELEKEYGGFYPVTAIYGKVGGKWKAVPFWTSVNAVDLRTDLLSQAGLAVPTSDWTWEDLYDIANKIKTATGVYGAGFQVARTRGDGSIFAYSVLWDYGGQEVKVDGRTVAIDSPGTRSALNFVKKLYKIMPPGVAGWDDGANNRAFLGGEIAMTGNSASIYWAAKKDKPEIFENMTHVIYPAGTASQALWGLVALVGIFDYCKYPDLAKDLIRYIYQPDNMVPWLKTGLATIMPTVRAYGEVHPMWREDPNLFAFVQSLGILRHIGWPGPVTSQAQEVFADWVVVDIIGKVAVLGIPVEKAVRDAVVEMEKIYAR